jgi:hypothetical protein
MRRTIKVYVIDRDYEAFAASAKAADRSLSTWMYRAAEAFQAVLDSPQPIPEARKGTKE